MQFSYECFYRQIKSIQLKLSNCFAYWTVDFKTNIIGEAMIISQGKPSLNAVFQ